MGALKTITRRAFLIGSVAVAGGVAFGTYLFKKPLPNPLAQGLKPGEAAITPYVKIDASGITLITPRADGGQGAYSVQATLLAEELDVDPHTVRCEPGPPAPAYYNGAALEEGAGLKPYDESWLADRFRGLMEVPAKLIGLQITGGSSTVHEAFDKLRHAGAVARETLKEAAARRAGVARSALRTENGFVLLPDGTHIAYGDLAADAATIDPVFVSTLRPETEWKYVGKPMQRIDIVRKSTGTEKYGIDLALPGMLHASVRTNPALGGNAISYDATRAEAMRGVKKAVPIKHGVAVIADNTWRAIRAVNAIDVQWGRAAYPDNSEQMWERVRTTLDMEAFDSRSRNDGDVDSALGTGEVIEAEYRVPYLAHAPLEPMNAIVRVDDGRVEIWTGTQIPRFIQKHVADMTGLAMDDVLVHVQPMGGTFGRRLEDDYVLQAVEIAMAERGTPVKMTWSREEDMTHNIPRPMQMARGRGKVSKGKIEALDLTIASQSVAASWLGRLMPMPTGPDPSIVAGAADQPFGIANYRVTGKRVNEMVPVSSWRSVGASGNGFLHGSFLDELMHAAGMDPMQGLIDLCIHEPSRKVLEALQVLANWTGPSPGEGRGRGVAFCQSFRVPAAVVVDVSDTPRGIKLDKVYVVADVGRVVDPVNIEAQFFGGVLWGLAHAINCEITYENQAAMQTNYHAYEGLRLYQVPEVQVKVLENAPGIRGAGEPGVPPAAPALANAIFAATGQRIRELPLRRHINFV